MIFRKQPPSANTLRTVGLIGLILASLSRWFLHPTPSFGPNLVDGVIGLFYGLSISCLLLSLRRGNRQCSSDEA
ncbi:MAG TPA: hypothetical protein VN956_19550 [Pyrinomonadaceae bacterium]|nr:hypothetical protein [Pyrinomonadaceae bacterium]